VPDISLPDIDISGIPPVAGLAVAALVGVAILVSGGGGGGEAAPAPSTSSSSSSSSSSETDLSIPYDAAAKLAYEKSDKSVPYDAFKEKYEADAVADVIAKKKK